MSGPLGNAAAFLIETLLGLCLIVGMLRLLLQWARADFYNPISQLVVRATQPVLAPLHRAIPSVAGIDLACVLVLVVIQLIELWASAGLLGHRVSAVALLVLSVAELVQLGLYTLLCSLLIEVVASWIGPGWRHPVLGVVYSLNAPLLRPARRLVPPLGGLDLSPLVVMVGLQLAGIVVAGSLRQLAAALG